MKEKRYENKKGKKLLKELMVRKQHYLSSMSKRWKRQRNVKSNYKIKTESNANEK